MFLSVARRVVHTYRRWRIEQMHGKIGWRRVPAGFNMLIDPNEWLGRTLMMGYYESHLVYCIYQCVYEGDICLDIGANQGYISMHLARAAGTTGCIIAVEPTSVAFDRLVQNVQRNGFRTIKCVNIAAGDRQTAIEIWCDPHESGHSSVYSRSSNTSFREVVSMKPVDSILAETLSEDAHSRIAFVKIDVEGYEPAVLDGMNRILSLSKPILWVEVNPPLLAKGGYLASDIEQRLEAYGYRFFKPTFTRNAIGIPKVTLGLCRGLDTSLAGKMADLIAAVPGSVGWQRIFNSKIHTVEGERLDA